MGNNSHFFCSSVDISSHIKAPEHFIEWKRVINFLAAASAVCRSLRACIGIIFYFKVGVAVGHQWKGLLVFPKLSTALKVLILCLLLVYI